MSPRSAATQAPRELHASVHGARTCRPGGSSSAGGRVRGPDGPTSGRGAAGDHGPRRDGAAGRQRQRINGGPARSARRRMPDSADSVAWRASMVLAWSEVPSRTGAYGRASRGDPLGALIQAEALWSRYGCTYMPLRPGRSPLAVGVALRLGRNGKIEVFVKRRPKPLAEAARSRAFRYALHGYGYEDCRDGARGPGPPGSRRRARAPKPR